MSTWGDFDVTGVGVYYVEPIKTGARVRLHRFLDGADIALGMVVKRPSFGLTATLDDRTVLYAQYDQESTELMLSESGPLRSIFP